MLLSELMKNTDVQISHDLPIRGITCRWQEVKPGWLYCCRRGPRADGHDFAELARQNGAAVIVAERDRGEGTLLAPDTTALWPLLCERWFGNPTRRLCVIGVTGTNGKTSTCHMLWSMLTALGHPTGMIGTVENRVGHLTEPTAQTTPDAYDISRLLALMCADGCTHAVMEVSSHALDQHRVDGVHFAAGVFTNLTQDHLDYHRTVERYAAAKRRLFTQCDQAIVNADDPFADTMLAGFSGNVIRFSQHMPADITAQAVGHTARDVAFTACFGERHHPVRIGIPGDFTVSNALAALSAATAVGIDFEAGCHALSGMTTVRGRAESVGTFRGATIVIDYAHTPDGIEKIGTALRAGCTGRLTILFGCGGDRDRTKRPLMAKAAAAVADRLIITSDNPRTEDPAQILADIVAGLHDTDTPYTVIPDRRQAIGALLDTAAPGDVLLLAGKGHETYQIFADRTVPFDERQIMADFIKSEDEEDGCFSNYLDSRNGAGCLSDSGPAR